MNNVYTIKFISQKKGKGLIAKKNISEGTIIDKAHMLLLSDKDYKSIQDTILYGYIFEWKGNKYAIALSSSQFMNHSFNPNVQYWHHYKDNTLLFFAIRDIKKGEELTVNYNGDVDNYDPMWFDVEDKSNNLLLVKSKKEEQLPPLLKQWKGFLERNGKIDLYPNLSNKRGSLKSLKEIIENLYIPSYENMDYEQIERLFEDTLQIWINEELGEEKGKKARELYNSNDVRTLYSIFEDFIHFNLEDYYNYDIMVYNKIETYPIIFDGMISSLETVRKNKAYENFKKKALTYITPDQFELVLINTLYNGMGIIGTIINGSNIINAIREGKNFIISDKPIIAVYNWMSGAGVFEYGAGKVKIELEKLDIDMGSHSIGDCFGTPDWNY